VKQSYSKAAQYFTKEARALSDVSASLMNNGREELDPKTSSFEQLLGKSRFVWTNLKRL
jgi:hypothetical protein